MAFPILSKSAWFIKQGLTNRNYKLHPLSKSSRQMHINKNIYCYNQKVQTKVEKQMDHLAFDRFTILSFLIEISKCLGGELYLESELLNILDFLELDSFELP